MSIYLTGLLWGGGKESLLSLHKLHAKVAGIKGKIYLFHYNYGQNSYARELEAANYYAVKYDAHVINTPKLQIKIPEPIARGINGDTHVKARNMVFISHAVNFCLASNFNSLIVPFTSEKNVMDSNKAYLELLQGAVNYIYPKFKLQSNLSNMAKTSHLELLRAKVDVSHVWSCDSHGIMQGDSIRYNHCGKCAKCLDFLNNIPDIAQFLKLVNYEK